MEKAESPRSDRPHRRPAAEHVSRDSAGASIEDKGHAATAQRTLADAVQNSRYMVAQRQQLGRMYGQAAQLEGGAGDDDLLQGKFAPLQRAGAEEEDLLQARSATVQRVGPDEDELLQGRFASIQGPGPEAPARQAMHGTPSNPPPRVDHGGLPGHLKSGIEALSGISMTNVSVHYNSARPAQLNALAYAQGADIHVAPGQEQHLPHEAWHVVQQAQGRVRPTMQMKDGLPVNDDEALEHEADVMGARANRHQVSPEDAGQPVRTGQVTAGGAASVQLKLDSSDAFSLFRKHELYGDVDFVLHRELVLKHDSLADAIDELVARRGPIPGAVPADFKPTFVAPQGGGDKSGATPMLGPESPIASRPPKPMGFAALMAEQEEQRRASEAMGGKGEATGSDWASRASKGQGSKTQATSSPGIRLPAKQNPVQGLVGAVQSWDRKKDAGKTVSLDEKSLENLLTQLAAITSQSGASYVFAVSLTEGESKYDGNVCLKVVAWFSQKTSQATTHNPTYHFQIRNMDRVPDSLRHWMK